MILADALIAVAVVLVTAGLGRRLAPRAQLALWISALLVSAGMFLPMSLLRALVAPDVLVLLESTVHAQSWTLEDMAHAVAFAWLALVLWGLRPDLRGWRVIAVLLVLGVATELMQGLTDARSARIEDVVMNLLGAALGLALAACVSAWRKRVHARRTADCAGPDVGQ